MAQILDLGKVRFNWAGAYSNTTQYEYNDLVTYGPSLYAFTSATAATGVEPTNTGSWTLVVEGFDWRGTYATGTQYFKNDVVTDGVSAFICVTKHTASQADIDNNTNFTILALGQTDLPSQITAVNKVLSSDGIDPFWANTTYLTKGYWGAGQGQTAATVETASNYTNAVSVWATTANDYAQLAFTNTSNHQDASTDFIAYTNTGDDNSGFIDLGITSSQFNDPDFTITGENDGYLFMSAPRGTQYSVLIKQLLAGEYTLTLNAAHGWVAGNTIRVEGVDGDIDGQHVITAVPAGNKLSFAADPTAVPYTSVEVDPVGTIYRPVGNGDLVFATDASGLENRIVFAAGGFYSNNTQMVIIPDTQVHIEIATQSTSPTTGALAVIGGVGVSGNANVSGYLSTNGKVYAGAGAKTFETHAALTDAMAVAQLASDSFAQFSIVNTGNGNESSTDFIAYSSAGDNDSGWIDLGIANPNFDSVTYGITGPGDGYIFMSGTAARTGIIIASVARNLNVATITTTTPHKIVPGQSVTLTVPTQSEFTGTFTVTTTPTPTTFTFAQIGTIVPTTTAAGTASVAAQTGNLVLATSDTGTQNRIVIAAGGLASGNEQVIIAPDQFVHIEIATQSTSPTTGALIVAGGLGLSGNLNVAGDVDIDGEVDMSGVSLLPIGAGAAADAADFTNPVVFVQTDLDDYSQIIFRNLSDHPDASTDFIAYANNGDDNAGYIDMGITSSTFADPDFTITGKSDGYIFMEAPTNAASYGGKGNLVLATSGNGTENKIVFAAGGLDDDNTQMSITPNQNVHIEISTQSTSPTTGALTVVGGVGISGNMNIAGNVNISGTIAFGGGGTTVETENLAVTDPMIFVGTDNLTDSLDLAFVGEYAGSTSLDPAAAVTTRARNNNVATLGITYDPASPIFKVGDSVVIANTGLTSMNGTKTITAVTGNATSGTISFADSGSNITTEQASTEYSQAISNKELVGGVATLTAASHGFVTGETVVVSGVDATFNGSFTITGTTANSFSYAKVAADVGSQPATTAFTASVTAREVTTNVATLTTSAAHNYNIGESVVISGFTGLAAPLNGTFTITATPSATTFRFSIVTGDLLSEPATGVTAVVNRLIGTGKVYRVEGTADSTDVFRPRFAGIARDASATDKAFKLFEGLSSKPATTVDFSNADISLAPLEVEKLTATGAITGSAVTALSGTSAFKMATLTDVPSASTDVTTVSYVSGQITAVNTSIANATAGWSAASSAFTAAAGDAKFLDTSTAAFTVTLPTTGLVAYTTRLRFADLTGSWAARPPVLNPGTNKLMGAVDTLSLDLANGSVELIWTGATNGWRLV